jgi:lysozyme
MRKWLILAAGLAALLLFAGHSFAAVRTDKDGNLILDPQPGDDMTPVTTFSAAAVDFIRAEEGFRLSAYPDAGGWSIGYGHYLGLEKTVETITPEQAEAWLMEDIENAATIIRNNVTVPLNQNQFDALVDFLYNLGGKAVKGRDGEETTWIQLLNGGDYAGAAAQLNRWVYSEGRVNSTLVARRERERTLFLA